MLASVMCHWVIPNHLSLHSSLLSIGLGFIYRQTIKNIYALGLASLE